jgi:hypothetical protein
VTEWRRRRRSAYRVSSTLFVPFANRTLEPLTSVTPSVDT